jgi:hypothetical protein
MPRRSFGHGLAGLDSKRRRRENHVLRYPKFDEGNKITGYRQLSIAVAVVIVVLTGATARGSAESNLALANTLSAVVDSTTPLTLALTTSDGVRVRVLAPGTYTVVVVDKSSSDNFHLIGPDIDEQTTLEFVGTVTWTLTFTPGGYAYRTDGSGAASCGCSPNFRVSQPAPTELRGTVAAGTISLKTPAGARVVNVAAGRYVIVVLDRSRRDNFHLSGNGVNRRTGLRSIGRTVWTITLAPRSLYKYRSDSNPLLRRTFRTLD